MHWIAPKEKDSNSAALKMSNWDLADQFSPSPSRFALLLTEPCPASRSPKSNHHGPDSKATLSRAMPDWQKRKDALAYKSKRYLIFGLTANDSQQTRPNSP